LEKELQGHKERMLQGAEFRSFLRHLAQESERLQIKMISLTPREEKDSLPGGEKSIPTLFQYRRVTVHMVLHSSYSALIAYLQGLGELSFLTVDRLQIEQGDKIRPLLQVTLGLSVHIISL
jgi:hypothetical protein